MAAHAWVSGGLTVERPATGDSETVTEARLMGFDEAAIAALKHMLGRPASPFAGVWPHNIPAVIAFLAAASQWRTTIADRNGRIVTRFTGLDYAGAAIAWSARGIKLDAGTFDRLTIMEMAARDALNGDPQGTAP